jgi:C-terminal processing protease CtpA/Prc
VIAGSLADRDGRIQKGDRVLSINGRSTKGVSHREALSILKVRPLGGCEVTVRRRREPRWCSSCRGAAP